MLLTSSLETSGPKSTKHYLVLHHNDRPNLVVLPKSYAELEKLVKQYYHFDAGHFYVETDELNICKGKRVPVPRNTWEDIAELLGNVHVVSDSDNPNNSHPESAPSADIQPEAPRHVTEGQIGFNTPLTDKNLLVITTGHINTDVHSSFSTEFKIELIDEKNATALKMSVFPGQGKTSVFSQNGTTSITRPLKELFFLQTGHHIIIRKDGARFLVLFDSKIVAAVEAPPHVPITTVTYSLGTPSPFIGPIAARVYNDVPEILGAFGMHNPAVWGLNKEKLYQEALACKSGSDHQTLKALETIRNEFASFNVSSCGVKWQGKSITTKKWEGFNWGVDSKSVFILRYNIQENMKSNEFQVRFYNGGGPLRITMDSDNAVKFGDNIDTSSYVDYHTLQVDHSMRTPGKHSLAIVNNLGKIHAMLDFKTSTVLPKSTIITRKPIEVWFDISVPCTVDIDMYDFA